MHNSSMASFRLSVGRVGLVESLGETQLDNKVGGCCKTAFIAFTGDVGEMVASPHEESPILGAV